MIPKSEAKPHYVDVNMIHPGQSRYSQKNVDEKITELLEAGRLIKVNDGYKLGLNKNHKPIKAVLRKKKDAMDVVKGPFGLLLLDGHHHVMASLQVGSKKIPVRVVADHSKINEEQFWKIATDNNWVHLKNLQGSNVLPPKTFTSLVDDPNRYFAGITAVRNKKPSEHPIWIKNSSTPNFTEFKIADLMYQNGIVYDDRCNKEALAELVQGLLQENKACFPNLQLVGKP